MDSKEGKVIYKECLSSDLFGKREDSWDEGMVDTQ